MRNVGPRLEDVATLAKSPLLAALDIEDVGNLLERLEVIGVARDETVQREAEPADSMGFLLEGGLRVEQSGTARSIRAGDCFGEIGFGGHGPHIETVIASDDARIARFSRGAVEQLARAHPRIALHFTQALLAHVAGALAAQLAPTRAAVSARARDMLPKEVDTALVVAARLGDRAVSLDSSIGGQRVAAITTATGEGREVYRRSAGLALLEAARRIGAPSVRLGPSITSGRLVQVEGAEDRPALAVRLTRALEALIEEDVPLQLEHESVERAVMRFTAQGWDDAVALLDGFGSSTVELLRCGEVWALGPGPLLPSTGMLAGVHVLPHPQGLLLDFGAAVRRALAPRPYSTLAMEMRAPRYGSPMTRSQNEWLSLMGITSVGHFNAVCVSGRVKELILVSEGFHEKHIAQIADAIRDRHQVRIVAVAGPSASGKTTFLKRLAVQLQVNGIDPVGLSLDDYYLDRSLAGERDPEALEALDLALLDEHTKALLAGESVRTARYDFRTGRSVHDGGPLQQLGPGRVLVLEGIHALNPGLLSEAATDQTVRIFVHPGASLPFDRLSRLEPSDVRLMRRIVRDRHQRGFGAADNLSRWESVRRGERLSIFPFQGNADWVFDSSLAYEPSVLRVYAERYLLEVPRSHAAFTAARRLRKLLEAFVPIHPDTVPPTSLLREFIGGSGFSY